MDITVVFFKYIIDFQILSPLQRECAFPPFVFLDSCDGRVDGRIGKNAKGEIVE